MKDFKKLALGMLYLVLINLPVATVGLVVAMEFESIGFAVVAIAVSIPSLVLFLDEARWLGGRFWLVAVFLSTLPSLVIITAIAGLLLFVLESVIAPGFFLRRDAFVAAIVIPHAAAAILSLIGAAFYGPLSRWIEHRRDR